MEKEIFALSVIAVAFYTIFIFYRLEIFGANIHDDIKIARHNLKVDLGIKEWSAKEFFLSWRWWYCFLLIVLFMTVLGK